MICRNDGRCQYAIDHGAEGLGHCPKDKCAMPLCDRCHGAGTVTAMTYGHGPDDYEYDVDCPDCGGTGEPAPR